jgi:hypothetical protein
MAASGMVAGLYQPTVMPTALCRMGWSLTTCAYERSAFAALTLMRLLTLRTFEGESVNELLSIIGAAQLSIL